MDKSENNIVGSNRKKTGLIIALTGIALPIMIIGYIFYIFFGATPRLKAESMNAKEINITWRAVRNSELYNIYRMDESNGEYKKVGTVKESKFTDSKLKPESTYWYKVAVIRNGKEGKLSSPVKETTKSLPAAPSELSVETVAFDSAVLKWNAVKEAEKYYIYRADGDKNEYKKVGESTGNTFNDSKLKATTNYKYKITAINKNGESEYSNLAEALTKEKVNDRGNSGNNLANGGLAAEQGEWIYFTNKNGYNGMYKMKKDGTSTKKLYDGYIESINVIGDWVYFSNHYQLCKIKTDGSGYTEISDEAVSNLTVIGEWIYYAADGFNKMKTDGSGKTKLTSDDVYEFNVEGDWIYYSNISDKNKLYKIKTDGSGRVKLTEDKSGCINLSGDWIYYKNVSDGSKIYKIKTDGTGREKVLSDNVNMFNVTGDTIIYENWGYGGRLFKVGTDGKNYTQLADSHYNHINIVDNYIFCYNFDTRNIFILKLKDEDVDLNKATSDGI